MNRRRSRCPELWRDIARPAGSVWKVRVFDIGTALDERETLLAARGTQHRRARHDPPVDFERKAIRGEVDPRYALGGSGWNHDDSRGFRCDVGCAARAGQPRRGVPIGTNDRRINTSTFVDLCRAEQRNVDPSATQPAIE